MTLSFAASHIDPLNPVILDEHYREVKIPKYKLENGKEVIRGWRILNVPCDQLKQLQRELLEEMLSCRDVRSSNVSHAFTAKRGIKTMAENHVGKNMVIRIDIKDFFPSINRGMVQEAMLDAGYPVRIIRKVLQLCFYKDALPQGAPTSPFLSNVVGRLIDRRVLGLCKSWRHVILAKKPRYRTLDKGKKVWLNNDRFETITYTRYADDLVLSSTYEKLAQIINPIRYILAKLGFTTNRNKVSVLRKTTRQVVCGITVNQKLSKPKNYRKTVRATLHNMIMQNAYNKVPKGHYLDRKTGKIGPIKLDQLQGMVAHVMEICFEQGHPLELMLSILQEIIKYEQKYWSQATRTYLRKHPDVLFA